MLKSLFIQNFVLIDNLDIRFDKGWQEYKERFG